MTTSGSNLAPIVAACEGNCEGKNDSRTEAVRRVLQSQLAYGAEPYLSRSSGVCLSSVRHQVAGEQRLSAPLLRSALLLLSPDETAELLSMWLGLPLSHRP